MSQLEDLLRAHEPDVAWMVALWIGIHGGDSGPGRRVDVLVDETTTLLAAALSARLSEVHGLGPVSHVEVAERLGRAGLVVRNVDKAGLASLDLNTVDTGTGPTRGPMTWKCVYVGGDGWVCTCVARCDF